MAMTGSGLSAAIKAAIEANYNPVYGTPKSDTQLQLFCDALGDAIVTYIQGNAEVPVAVAHVTPSGASRKPCSATVAPS